MPRGGLRPGAGRKPAGAAAKGQPISVRLPDEMIDQVAGLATHLGISRSALIERLVGKALRDGSWRPDGR